MTDLETLGWSDHWAALAEAEASTGQPGRVVRHDGVAVQVRTDAGERTIKLRRGVDPITVGDWLVVDGEQVVALLPRRSLLRRRAAGGDDEQLLAANLDLVLIVCGFDRRIVPGRIQRGEALARDAGAEPLLVLTKRDLAEDVDRCLAEVVPNHPGLDYIVTSAVTGECIPELRGLLVGATSVLLGESGAGKSRLVNALLGAEVARVGAVRASDSKGRHTTTNRQLHVLPEGGVIIDSPGIREVGLAGDEESVAAAFADIDELGEECHFSDCGHSGEPGCAIALAIEAGEVARAAGRRVPGAAGGGLRPASDMPRPAAEAERPVTGDAALERRRDALPRRPPTPTCPSPRTGRCCSTRSAITRSWWWPARPVRARAPSSPSCASSWASASRGLIGHTQPRRLAARAVSERVAEELGVEIGGAVGYTVRFNDRVGPDTYLKVMTDGILLAEIQRDRMLRAYEVLIIDEAHERSLNIDFILGYLRELLPERPDLKVIITSATIDTERFSRHFGGAPVVEVSGRSHPVEVRYRPIGDDAGG